MKLKQILTEDLSKSIVAEVDCGNYLVKDEIWWDQASCPDAIPVKCAYNKSGDYIGDVETAKMLDERSIRPEKANPEHNVCSIGFSDADNKWYGWSHRAIYGFGIGDKCPEGVDANLPPKAITLDDAKAFAKAFASSVS